MEIKVIRNTFTEKSTIGELYIDGKFYCYTLEDRVRGPKEPKVYGETAIPAGTYGVIVNHSVRFNQRMMLYLNVPGFDGVRLHAGNSDRDSTGCTLVGLTKSKDFIGESRAAYAKVFPLVRDAYDANHKVTITFIDQRLSVAPAPAKAVVKKK